MISKQINGRKAKYAGDATLQLKDRAFGFVHYDTADSAYASAAKRFMADLKKSGVNLVDEASYVFDLNAAQQDSQTIMAKFNAAHIPVIAFDIPAPGAYFMGAPNRKSGIQAGTQAVH